MATVFETVDAALNAVDALDSVSLRRYLDHLYAASRIDRSITIGHKRPGYIKHFDLFRKYACARADYLRAGKQGPMGRVAYEYRCELLTAVKDL